MFLTEATVTSTPSRDHWKHVASLVYRDRDGTTFRVLPGAITDAASIPRTLWPILGSPMRDSRIFKAASIHDQLYKTCGSVKPGFTRAQCDAIFYRALVAAGLTKPHAAAFWVGVRIGGWVGWSAYNRDNKETARQRQFLQVSLP